MLTVLFNHSYALDQSEEVKKIIEEMNDLNRKLERMEKRWVNIDERKKLEDRLEILKQILEKFSYENEEEKIIEEYDVDIMDALQRYRIKKMLIKEDPANKWKIKASEENVNVEWQRLLKKKNEKIKYSPLTNVEVRLIKEIVFLKREGRKSNKLELLEKKLEDILFMSLPPP
jgi:hypothetical protein